jgi:putative ATP-dependent endonuclease of OLD family
MLIKSVSIKNFCSCSNLTIELAAFNPIIGYNNSGKSNMLRAIGWLLKKSVLPKSSFFDQNQPVIVEGIISGVDLNLLPTNQQQATAPYVINSELCFRRRQDTPQSTAAQIKIEVLDPGAQQWKPNPAGLDTAIGVLFPDPLYIEAMEDAAEDVGKFGAKNTIGELIKKTILLVRQNNAAAVHEIDLALQRLDSHLNGTTRIQELASLEANATNAVDDFFPGLSLKINFQTPQLDEILKGATVDLSERPDSSQPFSSFGHGAQRTVQMALIRLLAETAQQTTGTGPTTVLLIDEPELYLTLPSECVSLSVPV